MDLRDHGWVWEGQGIYTDVHPSIYGVGEGARFFGLRRAHFMFHPNTALAMAKLASMGIEEIVCDISKWRCREENRRCWLEVDAAPGTVRAEAEQVGRLSLDFPQVVGAIHDDLRGLARREGYSPDDYAPIHAALKAENPGLKLWTVVYSHELSDRADVEFWQAFAPYIDVVEFWIWESRNLPGIDDAIARCREVLPGKPVVMGCYLRDYTLRAAVPMDRVKHQWHRVAHHIEGGALAGYAIIATVLLDTHQEQAAWVRDFIAGG